MRSFYCERVMNKQTQTKMFNFSDTDLDFCGGSKNKFPDVFKKMLATGFNNKVVSNVTVSGDQVTLDYGVNHGYVADRVLAINTTGLSGEFYIDSVTTNTVKITVAGAPASIAGGFVTKIASLGWQLVYEASNIHIYKFKDLDESDLFLRLCFQNVSTGRNCVSPCIGKTANLTTGEITDTYALEVNKAIATPTAVAAGNRWEFSGYAAATYDNYTYTQGRTMFGDGVVVGSFYHLVFAVNVYNSAGRGLFNAVVPAHTASFAQIQRPLLLTYDFNGAAGVNDPNAIVAIRPYLGAVRCVLQSNTANLNALVGPQALNSHTEQDSFNTTTCEPISIYEQSTRQHLGYAAGGMYLAKYASTSTPSIALLDSPNFTADIDLNSKVAMHYIGQQGNPASSVFFAIPVEPIKYA